VARAIDVERALFALDSGSNKVSKTIIRDLGGSDLGQLPYCYMRPSAKLAVKPTN
jgi:hypothetical protein